MTTATAQWIGGLSLVLGLYPVFGALVLVAFLVLATVGLLLVIADSL